MRYRIAMLGLFAVLPVLTELSSMPAAPAPPRRPEVYALVYVGWGKNDDRNGKRVAEAAKEIQGYVGRAYTDPQIRKFPVIQRHDEEVYFWFRKKFRVARLEETAVLRVWLEDGTPDEQAAIINCVVKAYIEEFNKKVRREYLRWEASHDLTSPKVIEALRERDEELASAPRPLEWAAVRKAARSH